MKPVRIWWNDCFSIDHWQAKEVADFQTRDLMECQTIGFIIKRARNYITVCHTMNAEGSVCGVIQIPKKMIYKIENL